MSRTWRWLLIGLVLLSLGIAASLHFATRALQQQITQVLGGNSTIGEISLGLFVVTVNDVRIKAPPDWPTTDALRAQRIKVRPDWRALLSQRIAIHSIHVEGAYLSILRNSNGKLRLLPSLLEQPRVHVTPPPEVSVGEVVLVNAALDFYDATIARSPYLLRLEKVEARLGDLSFPALQGHSPLTLSGIIKGRQHDGSYTLQGWIEPATLDSELKTSMRSVDLRMLQPYLIKATDSGVRRGLLDLDLTSTVKRRHLQARGVLSLRNLELEAQGSILGLPRQAAINALKDGRKDIRIDFSLNGSLDDPKFSVNESLAIRFGTGLAEALGISIGDLGKSVGGAAAGIGGALRRLFRQ